jgi:hypothetical protein
VVGLHLEWRCFVHFSSSVTGTDAICVDDVGVSIGGDLVAASFYNAPARVVTLASTSKLVLS